MVISEKEWLMFIGKTLTSEYFSISKYALTTNLFLKEQPEGKFTSLELQIDFAIRNPIQHLL